MRVHALERIHAHYRELVDNEDIPRRLHKEHRERQVDPAQRCTKNMASACYGPRKKVAENLDRQGPVMRLLERMRRIVVRRVHNNLVALAH